MAQAAEFEIVVNTQFGGFCLTKAIVTKLRDQHCLWVHWIGKYENSWYSEQYDNIEFRCDPQLVAAVKAVTVEFAEKTKDLSRLAADSLRRAMLGGLEVQTGCVDVGITDHDGKETVVVSGSCS